ncbi:uncharacterized protein DS421_17g578490 [Arachis hypogaea]|nr:uncharacterized protein DS421_17g578490 [Arachis hypogaea]
MYLLPRSLILQGFGSLKGFFYVLDVFLNKMVSILRSAERKREDFFVPPLPYPPTSYKKLRHLIALGLSQFRSQIPPNPRIEGSSKEEVVGGMNKLCPNS